MTNLNKQLPFAALTVGQVDELFCQYVERIKAAAIAAVPENKPKEALNIDEALALLAELGYPTTKANIYQRVAKRTIPYQKVGNKRLVFSRSELTEWVQSMITKPESRADYLLRIAKSANQKLKSNGKQ